MAKKIKINLKSSMSKPQMNREISKGMKEFEKQLTKDISKLFK